MSEIEIEVKFFLDEPAEMERKIAQLGASHESSVKETNIRYETPGQGLLKKRSLLRLRKAERSTLTYKSEPPGEESEYKVHTEYEVCLDDFEMMEKILEALGFYPAQTYEKIRRTYRLSEAELCLDTMPYGNFLEIEGPKETIRSVSEAVGLAWKERILMNYLEMFERIKSEKGLSFTDVTFENFAAIPLEEVAELIRAFQAG